MNEPILRDIGLDLPSSFFATAQPKALREDGMKISITRDGRVYFRDTKVLAKLLPILIRGAVGEGAEERFTLPWIRVRDTATQLQLWSKLATQEFARFAFWRISTKRDLPEKAKDAR